MVEAKQISFFNDGDRRQNSVCDSNKEIDDFYQDDAKSYQAPDDDNDVAEFASDGELDDQNVQLRRRPG